MGDYTIKGMHHICINTMEVDKSIELYTRFFGFRVLRDVPAKAPNHRMVFMEADYVNMQVEIVGMEAPTVQGPMDHLCLLVSGIDELVKELKDFGVSVDENTYAFKNDAGEPTYTLQFVTGFGGERIEFYEIFPAAEKSTT